VLFRTWDVSFLEVGDVVAVVEEVAVENEPVKPVAVEDIVVEEGYFLDLVLLLLEAEWEELVMV
jgi:hypothetical protein